MRSCAAKSLRYYLLPLFALFFSATSPAQTYTTITATTIVDGGGAALANGTIGFVQTNGHGVSVGFNPAGGGTGIVRLYVCNIVNGAITTAAIPNADGTTTCHLANTALTTPPDLCFSATIFDADQGVNVQGPGLDCIQPTGATFSLDGFHSNNTAVLPVVQGLPGISFKWRGAWSANGIYVLNDVVSFNGSSWICIVLNGTGAGDAVHPDPAVDVNAAQFWNLSSKGGTGFTSRGTWSGSSSYAVNDVVSYQGSSYVNVVATAPTAGSGGTTGTTTTTYNTTGNLYDYTTATDNTVIQGPDGHTAAISGYTAADYTYVHGLSTIVSNVNFQAYGGGSDGWAYYDANKVFTHGGFTDGDTVKGYGRQNQTGGPPLAVQAGDYFFRFWRSDSDFTEVPANQVIVNGGTTLQAFSAYQPPTTTTTGGSGGTAGTPSAVPTDTTHWNLLVSGGSSSSGSGVSAASVSNIIKSVVPVSGNRYDPAKATLGSIVAASNGAMVPNYAGWDASGSIFVGDLAGVGTINSNVTMYYYNNGGTIYSSAFYDGTGAFLAAGPNDGVAPNTGVAVPTGAVFFSFYSHESNTGAGGPGNGASVGLPPPQIMVYAGTSTPSSYVPFGSSVSTDSVARAAAQPMSGENVGWLGDSISYGQGSGLTLSPLVNTILGSNDAYSLSWSGRRMSDALNNSGNTGVAFPTQSTIQGLKVLVLWLGTNLNNTNIGTISDAPSVGTTGANGITFPSTDSYTANFKGVLNQLYTWNPTLRIIKLSPYQSANQNGNASNVPTNIAPTAAGLSLLYSVHASDLAVGQFYSMPVVDMYSGVGIGPQNFATALVDYVHPTAYTQTNLIAPFIAHQIIGFAQK